MNFDYRAVRQFVKTEYFWAMFLVLYDGLVIEPKVFAFVAVVQAVTLVISYRFPGELKTNLSWFYIGLTLWSGILVLVKLLVIYRIQNQDAFLGGVHVGSAINHGIDMFLGTALPGWFVMGVLSWLGFVGRILTQHFHSVQRDKAYQMMNRSDSKKNY